MTAFELDAHGLAKPSPFAGGRLSLDLVNTYCLRRGEPLEFLGSARELWEWLLAAEVEYGLRLVQVGTPWTPDQGERMLARALELRGVLNRPVRSIIAGEPVEPAALADVNAWLKSLPVYSRLAAREGSFALQSTTEPPEDNWLALILQDAVDLLCHGDLKLLKCCEGRTCIRVFYDTTKNHKRRWCIEKCSSQRKAAAYYQRKKARLADTGVE